MIYLNSLARIMPQTTDLSTGALVKGTPEEEPCQVVDDTEITGAQAGTDQTEGPNSTLIFNLSSLVKEGDVVRILEIRGVPVERKDRLVKSVNIAGGFTASHREVRI